MKLRKGNKQSAGFNLANVRHYLKVQKKESISRSFQLNWSRPGVREYPVLPVARFHPVRDADEMERGRAYRSRTSCDVRTVIRGVSSGGYPFSRVATSAMQRVDGIFTHGYLGSLKFLLD